MKLQLLGITIGGCFLVYFGLKKTFEFFCDFVFVCGLKFLEELNFNEGLDPKVMDIYINKREPMFSHKGPISFLSPFLSLCLYLVGLIGGNNEEHHCWHH
jgi:hypothetical protein